MPQQLGCSAYCKELVVFVALKMNPNFGASSNPGWSIQLEVTGACDDMSSSCSSMHQNPPPPSAWPDLRAGTVYSDAGHVRLCHPAPTAVRQKRGNHCSAVSLFCFLHAPVSVLADYRPVGEAFKHVQHCPGFRKEVAGWHPLIVLWHKHDHKSSQ